MIDITKYRITFKNANNGLIYCYLPEKLYDEQLYKLELISDNLDNVSYMGIVKKGYDGHINIADNFNINFSNRVIQSYYGRGR